MSRVGGPLRSSAPVQGYRRNLARSLVVVMLMQPLLALASDPVPVQRPADDSSLGAASRQLEAVKSAADRAVEPSRRAGLPSVAMPPVQTPVESPAPVSAKDAEEALAKEKAASNWLVEAMMKPTSDREQQRRVGRESSGHERDDPKDRDRVARPGDPRSPRGTSTDDERSRDRAASARKTDEPGTAAIANPFDQYLPQWLSGGDYALIKGGPATGRPAGTTRPELSDTLVSQGRDLFQGQTIGAGRETPTLDSRSPVRTENPYLQTVDEATSATTRNAAVPGPVLVPLPKPATAPTSPAYAPAPEPLTNGRLPDFAKQPRDDKYYKPLKRF